MNKDQEKKKDFEKYLAELEDPKNNQEVNYDLPENPTPLQVAKFEICQEILGYKLDNRLSREQVAAKMDLSKAETKDILFCCIEKFTLDRLVEYASKLLDPLQVKVILKPRKTVNIMTELLIIKTENSEKVRNFLNKEKINYEIFAEENSDKEDKLLQEYQEAWQDPRRLAEAKQWEQASMNDWAERAKKDKK